MDGSEIGGMEDEEGGPSPRRLLLCCSLCSQTFHRHYWGPGTVGLWVHFTPQGQSCFILFQPTPIALILTPHFDSQAAISAHDDDSIPMETTQKNEHEEAMCLILGQ